MDVSLGKVLRSARERKGMTRTKLAEFTGISANSLAKYEKAGEPGGKYPSLLYCSKIAHFLEIDPRKLFDAFVWSGDIQDGDGKPIDTFTSRHRALDGQHQYEGIRADVDGIDLISAELLSYIHAIYQKLDLDFVPGKESQSIIDYYSNAFPDALSPPSTKQNGPNRNDPSRSVSQPSEAVGAAHDQPPEEGLTDE